MLQSRPNQAKVEAVQMETRYYWMGMFGGAANERDLGTLVRTNVPKYYNTLWVPGLVWYFTLAWRHQDFGLGAPGTNPGQPLC